ncbi:M24 family metallopeptidase [Shewanella psychromarinicola]|uniref:Aminopeptidase P family protein n=1 Tax=Shewanella psychromarinicola TaxID=2487742 RepID=A0A3N4EGG3_9GAMM|nr:Xaa-Pro peptidase family protein [Shewanella psychromarinicola]AZG35157.1 aminopeptidase P family protein [Shewanella psychromarinicola]MCL1083371.1 Xaa-Pro peptidase family protein [Shewanella psychromarinicola]RPA33041.1 aminopeptidase P family protein [Shewanella psychromarinicola]
MTMGVGGASPQQALATLANMTDGMAAISDDEFTQRIQYAQRLMTQHGLDAIYVNAGTNLYYFTGTSWFASERMVGAIIPAVGEVQYIAPAFELDTLQGYMIIKGRVNTWHEDESPFQLFADVLVNMGINQAKIGIDESTAFFISDGMAQAAPQQRFVSATSVTAGCRMIKSVDEIALMQRAKDMTLEVHKATASILREGITTAEVEDFINQAHYAVGAVKGSYFCIVLFGEDTAYPHGVKSPKALALNDTVLIDTGCQLQGYNSDITRTYVFGEANDRQRQLWQLEQDAQIAAFDAAQIGTSCSDVDAAARTVLEAAGFGPDYKLPGLPHRTGHGIGLDIHEWPYLVRNDITPLAVGMCFSNEPMICVPGEFGIRHEDHFYMTAQGPKWFTAPAKSIDDPFYLA